jgi:hypothetical protein
LRAIGKTDMQHLVSEGLAGDESMTVCAGSCLCLGLWT